MKEGLDKDHQSYDDKSIMAKRGSSSGPKEKLEERGGIGKKPTSGGTDEVRGLTSYIATGGGANISTRTFLSE